jgi:hypothetical protein
LTEARLLVLDPRHLISRTFGWLPIWDIECPPPGRTKPTSHRKMAARAVCGDAWTSCLCLGQGMAVGGLARLCSSAVGGWVRLQVKLQRGAATRCWMPDGIGGAS